MPSRIADQKPGTRFSRVLLSLIRLMTLSSTQVQSTFMTLQQTPVRKLLVNYLGLKSGAFDKGEVLVGFE